MVFFRESIANSNTNVNAKYKFSNVTNAAVCSWRSMIDNSKGELNVLFKFVSRSNSEDFFLEWGSR